VIAGAAYFPALDEIIVAARGEGCWWNGSRAAASTVAELSEARLVTTDARFLRDDARREGWTRLQNGARTMRTWGDCYGYLLVATGRADIMIDDVISDWDGAAFMPIITEAGGEFTDWRAGRPPSEATRSQPTESWAASCATFSRLWACWRRLVGPDERKLESRRSPFR